MWKVLTVSLETKEVSLVTKAAVQGLQTSSHFHKIIKWLSAPDPSTNLNEAQKLHQPGTGQWLLDSEKYQSWKKDQGSFLWLYGIPGCGKTILSSTIVANLNQDAAVRQTLLYFYFNFTDIEKRSTESAIRSLIDQIFRKCPGARGPLESLYDSYAACSGQPTHASLQTTFNAMIRKCNSVYVILDGLDECEARSQYAIDGIIPWLKSLRNSPANMHLLVTSRPEQDLKSGIEAWATRDEMIYLQSGLVANDIRAYIHLKMQRVTRWKSRPDVQELITTALNDGANGM